MTRTRRDYDENPPRPPEMDRQLAITKTRTRKSGLDPARIPWHWVGGVLLSSKTGKPLAWQFDYDPKAGHAPYRHRWDTTPKAGD